jgi:hypothetical protein
VVEVTLTSGRAVRVRSLSWDDVEWHAGREEQSLGQLGERRILVRETLERLYGEDVFAEAAESNADVLALYNATIRHSYGMGLEEEIKNS